jgi:hypothetical protein
MRTLTRFVAAVVTAAVVPACSVIARSAAHADPVATTATEYLDKAVNQELVAVAEQSDVRHQSDVLRHRAGCLPRILLAYRIGDLSMTFQ